VGRPEWFHQQRRLAPKGWLLRPAQPLIGITAVQRPLFAVPFQGSQVWHFRCNLVMQALFGRWLPTTVLHETCALHECKHLVPNRMWRGYPRTRSRLKPDMRAPHSNEDKLANRNSSVAPPIGKRHPTSPHRVVPFTSPCAQRSTYSAASLLGGRSSEVRCQAVWSAIGVPYDGQTALASASGGCGIGTGRSVDGQSSSPSRSYHFRVKGGIGSFSVSFWHRYWMLWCPRHFAHW
jgi:hypothetical protein